MARGLYDPLKLKKIPDELPDRDVPANIEQFTNQQRVGKRGPARKRLSPWTVVNKDPETGELIEYKQNGRPTKLQSLMKSGKVPDKVFYNIAEAYFHTGDWKTVAQMTGHTAEFLLTFRQHLKFHEMLALVREEQDKVEESKQTSIIESALDEINDRVKHGDEILDSKTGTVVKVKMKGKELVSVVKALHGTRQVTRKEPANFNTKESASDRNARLAEQFERFASARTIDNSSGEIE